jgi:hypothetical protein
MMPHDDWLLILLHLLEQFDESVIGHDAILCQLLSLQLEVVCGIVLVLSVESELLDWGAVHL